MLSYINNSQTAIVVLHEIYGVNDHITYICKRLSKSGFDVFAPNMLEDNNTYGYEMESAAYNNFIENIGFEKASDQVIKFIETIRESYKKVFIVGYSVGASIAWICSREQALCDGVVGFYGSRIRDYLELTPACPVLLFFPEIEKSFDVERLTNALNMKESVCAKILHGSHGFADLFSKNYKEDLYIQTYKELMLFISTK